MLRNFILSFLGLCLHASHAGAYEPPYFDASAVGRVSAGVPMEQLPKWIDRTMVLDYLNPSEDEFGAASLGAPFKKIDLRIYQKEVDAGKINGLILPGGWKIEEQSKGCLHQLVALTGSSSSKFEIKTQRNDFWLTRMVTCLNGGKKEIQSIVVPNENYFAFETSEPGWVFFDRKKGQFTGLIVDTKGRPTRLFRNDTGEILLSYRDAKSGDEKGRSGENVFYRFGYFGEKERISQ